MPGSFFQKEKIGFTQKSVLPDEVRSISDAKNYATQKNNTVPLAFQ